LGDLLGLGAGDITTSTVCRQDAIGSLDYHRTLLMCARRSPLSEIARVLLRFNHIASFIVNANHGAM
jgi:hypothetical protein